MVLHQSARASTVASSSMAASNRVQASYSMLGSTAPLQQPPSSLQPSSPEPTAWPPSSRPAPHMEAALLTPVHSLQAPLQPVSSPSSMAQACQVDLQAPLLLLLLPLLPAATMALVGYPASTRSSSLLLLPHSSSSRSALLPQACSRLPTSSSSSIGEAPLQQPCQQQQFQGWEAPQARQVAQEAMAPLPMEVTAALVLLCTMLCMGWVQVAHLAWACHRHLLWDLEGAHCPGRLALTPTLLRPV
mmetsp:Transcript_19965/g.43458  ORF Transcript_19965/g.43458 Transcript_19965/m.43458 type:complete len:245 (-) Transcript_19965:3109-3843(-)